MRGEARKTMLAHVHERYARQLSAEGDPKLDAAEVFKEEVLTIGFARRFATYKRPDFLLHDAERLVRLLTDPQRPVQLAIAGKAHPQDFPGQELIKKWNDFIQRPEVRGHVVFLSDYDMQMAQELVQGMDLWINTPRRPWEACGTSGMKVLANGGLNLSELDGWWAEAYSPEVGWAIGDGKEHGDDPAWDASEAEAMYALLENEVVPQFYERNAEGMPVKWLHRIRESMARLTQQFSASRAIREYTENHYLPAAAGYKERAENNGAVGTGLLQWKQEMERHWSSLRFGELKVESKNGRTRFQVEVLPGDVPADELRVELYAEPVAGGRSGHRSHERREGGGSRGCVALRSRCARDPSRQRLHAARASPPPACAPAARIDAGPLEKLIHPSPSVRASSGRDCSAHQIGAGSKWKAMRATCCTRRFFPCRCCWPP